MTLGKKKQDILDSLYNHCRCRTNTSKDVLEKLLDDVKVFPGAPGREQLLGIIREYKNSGKNLEATINSIYDILYPASATKSAGLTNYDDWGT